MREHTTIDYTISQENCAEHSNPRAKILQFFHAHCTPKRYGRQANAGIHDTVYAEKNNKLVHATELSYNAKLFWANKDLKTL